MAEVMATHQVLQLEVLVEAAVAVEVAELQVLLAKETLEAPVETGAAEAVAEVPEAPEAMEPDLTAVLEVLEFLIQLLVVLYTTPEAEEAVEMEEATEPGVTVAEVLGQLLPMLSMVLAEAVVASPQVQTLEELEAMV